MESPPVRFGPFSLDPGNRQLTRDGQPIELNARYLDALALLVREPGRLVTKDRFLGEVWRGVPVTDEALTQCIKTLRRQLGDDAAAPRFIETVPKHGYRFIAPVSPLDGERSKAVRPATGPLPGYSWRQFFALGGAGTLGGAAAGFLGGLLYGFVGASEPLGPGVGAISVLLVLVAITVTIASIGAAGVSFGIAAAGLATGRPWKWSIVGGAMGGMLVGAFVKLLGLDAFDLLFGQRPGDITGAPEGLLIGAAVGLGAWLASRQDAPGLRRSVAWASLAGAAAGVLVPLLGGRMMAGSLDQLARSVPGSRLRLDELGRLLGEPVFGPITQAVTGALEGALFGGCVVGAIVLAKRNLGLNEEGRPLAGPPSETRSVKA